MPVRKPYARSPSSRTSTARDRPPRTSGAVLPHTAPTPSPGECTQLLARVRQVRDELAHQERQIAQHRQMLDQYLGPVPEWWTPLSPVTGRSVGSP
ncbi:hypothetical protein NKH77_52480 [Streptomyces sp. M19]